MDKTIYDPMDQSIQIFVQNMSYSFAVVVQILQAMLAYRWAIDSDEK